ncbi:MAG: hypothetical protein KGV58_01430 [Campylobacteraceae bacterium]|nr:hypothetical protein [Campylobacteraceae bacterium]
MKNFEAQLKEAQEELEELSLHVLDTLEAAFHFAGAKKEKMQEILDAYTKAIDELYGNDDEGEMGAKEIIELINHLKKTHKELFN